METTTVTESQYDLLPNEISDKPELEIKKMIGDARDPDHPFLNKSHPLHGHYKDYWDRLHTAAAEKREDPLEKMHRDLVSENAVKKEARLEKLRSQVNDDVTSLNKAGHSYSVPEATEVNARYIRMHRFNSDGNISELSTMISQDGHKYGRDEDVERIYTLARDPDMNEKTKKDLMKQVINHYYKKAAKAEKLAAETLKRVTEKRQQ